MLSDSSTVCCEREGQRNAVLKEIDDIIGKQLVQQLHVRHVEKQIDRHKDRQTIECEGTDRQAPRHAGKQTDKRRLKDRDGQEDRRTPGYTYKMRQAYTYGQIDKQPNK